MFEPEREAYEYHINLLSVKMKVKFPCRMKIEHQGSLLTGQAPLSSDSRYIFNQQVILKDQSQRECFELTINLLTDKGAKYIAGIIKLYHSELIRSEGERLVLSLSKCIDSEAFCEIKVDQVVNLRGNNNAPYDRKSTLQRQVPFRQKDGHQMDLSPHRNNYYPKIQQSKSEYQFPLHQNKPTRQDWDSKSKSRFQPPQTVYQRSKVAPRVNYMKAESPAFQGFQGVQSTVLGREKALEAEVYKEGYQKLKQKYKKETQVCKQQLNKRLALQNSQNNLKLQIMRLKLRVEEHEKSANDKSSKIKEYQAQISMLQQKQIDNGYLREQLNKKEQIIRSLEDKNRSLSRSLEELRDLTADRNTQESNKIKELQLEMENLRLRMESKERELEKQNRSKVELLHQKELQLVSKSDSLQRERKTVGDLQKALQNKGFELQKLLQNERNGSKVKLEDYKARIDRFERDQSKLEDEKKQLQRELQILRSNVVKAEYDKKILNQEFDSIKSEYGELKPYKQKYNELVREHRSVIEERTHLERQLERTIQNKEVNLSEINKQFTDQMEYYKRINRQLDEKVKSLSNKLIEVEGQYELSRNQQDKLRRNLQAAVKESSDAREKEKIAKKALKNKEQETLSMQSDQATLKQKLKNIDQIYKLEIDKARDEGDKYRVQFEEELAKSEELLQSNTQFNMELNRIKIKLQYAQERADKDAANLKDKQNQVESLIKDYEEQISSLEQVIVTLRQSQKDLSNKVQKYEVDFIKSEEKIERSKKDIKIFEERCINYENSLKTKQNELLAILKEKQTGDKRSVETDAQLNHVKNDMLGVVNQRNKLTKMNELLQEQIKKAKSDINNYATQLSQKDKNQQELRSQVKMEKEENAKIDLKFTTYRKQTERYKQTLFETIQKYLSTIPLQNTPQDSRKSLDLFIAKKPSESSFSEAFSLITNYSKEIKQFVSKQSEQIKQIQRENERMHEEVSASANKCQNSEMTLKRQLEQLELQLHQTLEQKEEESANFTAVIGQLNEKISQLQMIEQELNTQIEQLNFTNNSLKMDYDAFNDQNSKKISNLKKLNSELEEKIEYQAITIAELDERSSAMEADIDNLEATIQNDNEVSLKKDKIIEEIREAKERQEQTIEDLKKQKKDLTEKVSELELHLNTQREIKEKTKQLLDQQEAKASELKVFISNLMKQKQIAIKNQLERSESIINLETNLLETNKQLELLKEQNQRNFKTLEAQKEQNKKLNASIKDIENERRQQKTKHTKTQQKLREKEKQLLSKEDLIKKMEQKYQKMSEKYKVQLRQIQEELDLRSNTSLQQTKDSNERIIQLQSQIQKKTSIINTLQMKLSELEEEFYAERQKNNNSDQMTNRIRGENEELRLKINEMDISLNEIADDSKEKEEKLFEFSGKIYTLELKLEAKDHELNQKLQMLNNQWVNKYEAMCEQYQQRLELVQKERDYFKTLHEQKDKQISKLNNLLKVAESNESSMRKTYEEKVKKLEEEKLSLFSIKNSEIQRLIEQIKSLSENLKSREAELRRITNELEVARKTITNLDQKSKQYDEKVKGISKVYQTELEQLKKKDVANKTFREAISNHQWNAQREIKKLVQGFIKNFLEISEDKNSQRLLQLVRSLQKTIMQVLAAKPVEK